MTSCLICKKPVAAGSISKDICIECEQDRSATVSALKARILDLEMQLTHQKASTERADNFHKSAWTYNFSEEYLH